MPWFILALLAALSTSLTDVISKHNLKKIDEYVVAWSLTFFTVLFILPLLFFIPIPNLGNQFWIALLVNGFIRLATAVLYFKAIKHSDLSLTTPLITFTPLFLLITSPLIVREFPNLTGLIGVLLIVFGAYILNVKERSKGYLAPLKALLKNTGPRLMLAVAFLWGISSNFDKLGVNNSSPLFWIIATNIFSSTFLLLILLSRSPQNLSQVAKNVKALIPIGLFNALASVFQMTAIKLALVAYVISIKRTSVIMNVLAGWLIFHEPGIKARLSGAILMITGVILIAVS